jgi:acetyl-CoA C-acetyltransferase
LGAIAIKEALKRAGVPPKIISDVYMGHVLQAAAGQAPAKQAAVKAGLPLTVEATTINKVCASGLKAVSLAAQNIQLGYAMAQVAGGMESMSQVPSYSWKSTNTGTTVPGTLRKGPRVLDGLMDGLKSPFDDGQLMGCYADQIAQRHKISREDQDKYALESYTRASRAQKHGIYKNEVVPIPLNPRGTEKITSDSIQSQDKFTGLPQLSPIFSEGGTVTSGNACFLSDGASAVVLVNNTIARQYCMNSAAIAKIVAFADVSAAPADFAMAPCKSIRIALERAQLSVEQISLWEINEAFAVVVRLVEKVLFNYFSISILSPLFAVQCWMSSANL